MRIRGKTIVVSIASIVSVMSMFTCSSRRVQFSPFTQRFLRELEKSQKLRRTDTGGIVLSESMIKRFLVKRDERGYVVHGMIKVDASLDPVDLERLNIRVASQRKEVWSVIIPVQSLKALGRIKGVCRIEIDSPVEQRNL